ncbi:MAG: sulfatase, partial [Armatimonadetes bacterium]|nr:sulfatase [Armatimonadota bacterium]
LLDTLDAAGRLDEALVAVTADHGEGLGERGIFASHVSLLPPVLRVPL